MLPGGENIMSNTSHKSRTRILSEEAMSRRVHTSRAERDLTADGLDKHHHEDRAMNARSKSERTRIIESARRGA